MVAIDKLDLQYITNEAGEKTAVILTMEQFQEFLDISLIPGILGELHLSSRWNEEEGRA